MGATKRRQAAEERESAADRALSDEPLSLAPLSFREALAALLKATPPGKGNDREVGRGGSP